MGFPGDVPGIAIFRKSSAPWRAGKSHRTIRGGFPMAGYLGFTQAEAYGMGLRMGYPPNPMGIFPITHGYKMIKWATPPFFNLDPPNTLPLTTSRSAY